MSEKGFVVVGAGGHAKVVLEALRAAGAPAAACLDAEKSLWGRSVEGVRVEGGDDLAAKFKSHPFAVGVGAVQDTAARRKVYERFKTLGLRFPPVVAASAVVAPSAKLGAGTQVLTRAVVHPAAEIGENTVVNTGAVVEHDCAVGSHVFIAPAAVLCGGAKIGDGAFIAAGALILPGVAVGAGAFIGAGAVVNKDVPAGTRVIGRKS